MKLLLSAIILITPPMASRALALPQCLESVRKDELAPPRIKIDSNIPAAKRTLIEDAFEKIQLLNRNLKPLPPLEVVLTESSEFEGVAAAIAEGRIKISQSALALSSSAFEASMLHEFTHFLVARNFLVKSEVENTSSIYDYFQNSKNNPMADQTTLAIINQTHLPYAELLCDTAAVLLTRNPKVFMEIFKELYQQSETNPAARRMLDRATRDLPRELSSRDFSVSYGDPRWSSYAPQDMTYNRFNQIRSYLWQRQIQNLPPEQAPVFFAKLVQLLDPIHRSSQLDGLMMMNGLKASNDALVEYLESALKQ